ncbi:DNA alkylation repair protein [Pradoshia sp. D12]|uniref:DNA alkylation repair protein n=1 Tax=Bacillaceae TaxID=186817 RepID=UPI00111D085C|nr:MULTISPECIES: DNA alkylation repair protein [Bacillaceae]QFK73047.1 DNA alkylation repair protein [Pradoshia sp. D12]TPF72039.1 DNA alkylation repair protein [Bacillus sp. D12]
MDYINRLKQLFENEKNEEQAVAMAQYMKNQFPFYGIKTPERRKCMSVFFKETGILAMPLSHEFCLKLWNMPEREWQNAALDYLANYIDKLEVKDLPLLKTLITTKSWWDTVDMIASKQVGNLVLRNPDLIDTIMNDWVIDNNMWLRRTAILFQLSYKGQTNERILYDYILKNADSKEFFIQKAIGWALREYSKTDPESVKNFIKKTELAPLSRREGSKHFLKGETV